MSVRLITIVAAAALLSGAAYAQVNSAPPVQAAPSATAPAPSAVGPADSTGYNARPSADTGVDAATAPPAPVAPASSSALGDPAVAKAGDPGVVSNPPVADTAENRTKFGLPDSNAGKRSKARGN